MQSEARMAVWWTLYASTLMLISGSLYVFLPAPPLPVLGVEAEAPGFEGGERATVVFKLSDPARGPLAVEYDLEGDAKLGEDFVRDDSHPDYIIPVGGKTAPKLVLKRKKPTSAPLDAVAHKTKVTVVVALKSVKGATISRNHARVELPLEVDRYTLPDPYRVSVTSKDAKLLDAAHNLVTIDFELDREPEAPVDLRATVEPKELIGKDFDVVVPENGVLTLHFSPPKKIAQVVLKLRREFVRGEGDRTVTISIEPSLRFVPLNKNPLVGLTIPDPKSELTWNIEPAGTLDASKPSTARLVLSATPPRADRVVVRYTASAEPGLVVQPTLEAAPRILVLEPRKPSVAEEFQFSASALVGGAPRTLRIEKPFVESADAADAARLPARQIVVADDRPLPGAVFVLVILTADLAARSEPLLSQLVQSAAKYPEKLSGGSLYVLAGDRNIYRFQPGPRAFEGLKPFSGDDDLPDPILSAANAALGKLVKGNRLNRRVTLLVWQDFRARKLVADRGTGFGGSDDTSWRLIWIGPPASKDKVGGIIAERVFSKDRVTFSETDHPENLSRQYLDQILNKAKTLGRLSK